MGLKKWMAVSMLCWAKSIFSAEVEIITACLIPAQHKLTYQDRVHIAHCLGWHTSQQNNICYGQYHQEPLTVLVDDETIQVDAASVSLHAHQSSILKGNVEVRKAHHILQADLGYIERDSQGKISRIVLKQHVKYRSPDSMLLANRIVFYPDEKEATLQDVLYLIKSQPHGAHLWAYGRATSIFRNRQEQVFMQKATYTNCSPLEKAWEIRARHLLLDKVKDKGVAKHVQLRLHDVPILYSPYLTFPLSKKRKSGFLMPIIGSTTVGGFDMALPYYLNLAPHYDATFIPHLYTKRGLMVGGYTRYLTPSSSGVFHGNILSHDRHFTEFLKTYGLQQSTDRWDIAWKNTTQLFSPSLSLSVDARQLSDDYYLQDFSTRLSNVTDRQILRQGVINYSGHHWLFNGMVQSYQTLHPINETVISDAYERLPQFTTQGDYPTLPFGGHLQLVGNFDYFHWPSLTTVNPHGTRVHVSPKFSLDQRASWGYFTPAIQWIGNAYYLGENVVLPQRQFNLSIPRYSLDTGLFFERKANFFNRDWIQTLEPRVYYLNVPYFQQTQIPVFDSGFMIFTTEQVFRDNRYSGLDRVGDTQQVAYGLTTRWLRERSGKEQVSVTIAQIRYFAQRRVPLCYSATGVCEDNSLTLGYISPIDDYSPVASHFVFHFSPFLSWIGDYVWDPATRSTNNGQITIHYQGKQNQIFNFGYAYFVNGDLTQVGTSPLQDNALNQVNVSYAWPFTQRWSSVGAYSYNISKQYGMMGILGLQYDSCCWATRLLVGQTFRSLTPNVLPEYTNSIFLQFFLKGLGSVGTGDPTSVLKTYLPGYVDTFRS